MVTTATYFAVFETPASSYTSHETLTCQSAITGSSMSYSIQNGDIDSNSNISWNNQEPHQTQHLFLSNSSPNNNHNHIHRNNYNNNQHHNGIKEKKSYKSTHPNYISYRNNNTNNNGNQYLSSNRYRRSSKYRDQSNNNNNNNNLSRLRNKTFRRQYLRESDLNINRDRDRDKYKEYPSKSRYYDKDNRQRKLQRNMKDSDDDSSTFSFGGINDDSKQTNTDNNNIYNNNRKNTNDEHKFNRNPQNHNHDNLDSDSNNSSSSISNDMNGDDSSNDDDPIANNHNLPLTDSSLISDEEDTMNTRTVSISKSMKFTMNTNATKRKHKGLKIRTGSKSCCDDDEDREQHIFTPKANSVYTPKANDDDNKFFEEEGGNNNNNQCLKCNSYKSELDHFKGIGINNLSMDRLMNLEKELLVSISRIQSAINEKYKNEKLCIVCQNNMKNCVFRPCGHFSTCHICSRQLGKCPICMSTIDDKFKIFQ